MDPEYPFHYRWIWNLRASPAALWPLAADTNRFNRDTGLPPVQSAGSERLANARRNLRFRVFGMLIEWVEEPFEWIYPHRFGVLRRYRRGPLAEMRVQVSFNPLPEGGTRLAYEVWAKPRNILGYLAIPVQIGLISARRFATVFRDYDRLASHPDRERLPSAGVRLAPGGRARLAEIRSRLLQTGLAENPVDALLALVEHADDLALAQIRPYAMADLWHRPRREVLELFLWATRFGLLEFRWDTLCPHCRRSPESASSLRQVKSKQLCPSCNVNFQVDFDQTVELTFRPSPAIRQVAEGQKFCIAGPQTTPHIVAQQLLRPGEERALEPVLESGHYRLRLLELPGAQVVRVTQEGEPEAIFRARPGGVESQAINLSPCSRLVFENTTTAEQLFILERSAWNEQATPAADVAVLQTFRDLFASEALRPEEPISVGSLVIVFTDLRSSTRLYREIGDAPAFGSVMDHFDVLRQSIAAEGGAMVKTMGDAVMAVFRRPAEALRAMLAAQNRLAAPPAPENPQGAGERPLWLKVAINYGPIIAINANDRLDYFGTQVNLTARMVELSTGRDVIVTESVMRDPEVAALITSREIFPGGLRADSLTATFKGFEQEVFPLWRIQMARL